MSKTWYPVIDCDKCTGCLTCYNKCRHGVYALADGKPVVVKPAGCVHGCHGCGEICPQRAIEYAGDTGKVTGVTGYCNDESNGEEPIHIIEGEKYAMKKIDIYDPAMCCSTGVCGPSVDPELMRVATLVNYLSKNGIEIKRHNLSSEPQDFVANKAISDLLKKEGADVLPVTLVDGVVVKTKAYPTKDEFAKWLGIKIVVGKPMKQGGCCGGSGCC